jgi:hypothetical protein
LHLDIREEADAKAAEAGVREEALEVMAEKSVKMGIWAS